MRAFGRRSAAIAGDSSPARRSETVSDRGAASDPTTTQVMTRPISSHVPSTSSPSGARRPAMRDQAGSTSTSSYWRSTFRARIRVGRRGAGTSKPPRANETRVSGSNVVRPARTARNCSRARSTRSGSISRPNTSMSGLTGDRRAANSRVVMPVAPYPRSTIRGSDARRSTGCRAIHRSTRRNRFVPVVPRVGRPVGAEGAEDTPPMMPAVRARPSPCARGLSRPTAPSVGHLARIS